jgi:ubiquitin carboxyl-terminal hydrolase 7
MIFVKYFDVSAQSLLGLEKMYVQASDKLDQLRIAINEKMQWSPDRPLRLYEVRHSAS